jgi:GlcNAc-P-P-Und epimerase
LHDDSPHAAREAAPGWDGTIQSCNPRAHSGNEVAGPRNARLVTQRQYEPIPFHAKGERVKILIVGGSGFIGTAFTSILIEKGHSVSILDLKQSSVYPELCTIGDVRDLDTVKAATLDVDMVYNLAAEHADNVEPISLYYEVNVEGSKNVITAARENGVKRLGYISTGALYGLDIGEVDEATIPQPFNDYGKSKLQAEEAFLAWSAESPDHRLVILRPTVIFGENNRGNVYSLFRQIKSGAFAMIGNGANQKSLGYVKNIVAFLEHIIDLGPGAHIFNFADKPDLSMKELVETARSQLGKSGRYLRIPFWLGLIIGYTYDLASVCSRKKFSISSIRVRKFCEHSILNCDRLLSTGFTAPYSLPEAIRRTIKHEFHGKGQP